jgi:hypothetical protein
LRLICTECGAEAPPDASGWRVYLDDEDKPVTYCPACAAGEFGGESRFEGVS